MNNIQWPDSDRHNPRETAAHRCSEFEMNSLGFGLVGSPINLADCLQEQGLQPAPVSFDHLVWQ